MDEPLWIKDLLGLFLESIEWTNFKLPTHQIFGYHYKKIDDVWEIVISPLSHELYGGEKDGSIKIPKYELNLLTIAEEFDIVSYIGFDTDRMESSIEGILNDNKITLLFKKKPVISKFKKVINTFTGEVTRIDQ